VRKKYSQHKSNARKRGIPSILTFEEFKSLKLSDCFYCGVERMFLEFFFPKMGLNYPPTMTIDRRNNKEGYTSFNCVPSCAICNRIKGEFLLWEEQLEISQNYIKPKYDLWRQEMLEEYGEWCEQNVLLDEELEEFNEWPEENEDI